MRILALLIIGISSYSYAQSNSKRMVAVHTKGSDIQVFSAKLGNTLGIQTEPALHGTYGLNYDKCKVLQSHVRSQSISLVKLDCSAQTEYLAESIGKHAATLIAPVVIEAYRHRDGRWSSKSGLCELLEIWTVIKESDFRNIEFLGVGFYYSQASVPLIQKNRMKPTWRKHLKDGTPVVVTKFIAPGICFGRGGNGSTIKQRFYEFKPYALMISENPYGQETPVFSWDSVEQNYLLGRTKDGLGFVKYFDRSHELIDWK